MPSFENVDHWDLYEVITAASQNIRSLLANTAVITTLASSGTTPKKRSPICFPISHQRAVQTVEVTTSTPTSLYVTMCNTSCDGRGQAVAVVNSKSLSWHRPLWTRHLLRCVSDGAFLIRRWNYLRDYQSIIR